MQIMSAPYRELTLEDLIFVFECCNRNNDSKCNLCPLNNEYGDECIEVKNLNATKYLKDLERMQHDISLKDRISRGK